VGTLAVCTGEWVVDGGGVLSCSGSIYAQAAPVGWSMTQAEVGEVLSAVFVLFAIAFGIRTLVRFLLASGAGRGN